VSLVKSLVLTLTLALACAAPAANASVITFDSLGATQVPGSTGTGIGFTHFSTVSAAVVSGFKFLNTAAGRNAYIIGPAYQNLSPTSSQSYNGSDYWIAYSFTMSAADQSTFSLASIDIGNWTAALVTTTLTGTRADGSTVTKDVSATYSNRTRADDFSHVTLTGFDNLKSVSFSQAGGSYIAIDNVTINAAAVPEPASLALLGLGIAGMGVLRRRKKA